jgi:hypothetical protein
MPELYHKKCLIKNKKRGGLNDLPPLVLITTEIDIYYPAIA